MNYNDLRRIIMKSECEDYNIIGNALHTSLVRYQHFGYYIVNFCYIFKLIESENLNISESF